MDMPDVVHVSARVVRACRHFLACITTHMHVTCAMFALMLVDTSMEHDTYP